jgi:hypothetical protein
MICWSNCKLTVYSSLLFLKLDLFYHKISKPILFHVRKVDPILKTLIDYKYIDLQPESKDIIFYFCLLHLTWSTVDLLDRMRD